VKPLGFIVPAQPVGAKAPPSGPGWIHEIKQDGFRLIALRKNAGVALAALRLTSCTIDGEIAVCDDQGLAVFDRLRHGERIKHDAILFAFDLLELDDEDYSAWPIEVRKRSRGTADRQARAAGRAALQERARKRALDLARQSRSYGRPVVSHCGKLQPGWRSVAFLPRVAANGRRCP
jgi:bifunctional non-homologous end joining protein LigD